MRIGRQLKTGTIALIAALALALAAVAPVTALEGAPTPHLVAARSAAHQDVLIMQWRGPIRAPLSNELKAMFESHKNDTRLFVLRLDSGGGSVAEGERAIAVLQEIKKTHRLNTSVGPGRRCGSMCVFIYAQGQKRFAASASLWLFHEVSFKDPRTHLIVRLDRPSWERLVEKYWVPAGVSRTWIDQVKSHTNGKDYWEAGDRLLKDGSNLVHVALPDEQRRVVHPER